MRLWVPFPVSGKHLKMATTEHEKKPGDSIPETSRAWGALRQILLHVSHGKFKLDDG